VCDVVGWAWGHEVKRTDSWPGPYPERPAYYHPNDLLHSDRTIPMDLF
jgi:hypothetical protein